ncbi:MULTISPECIES: metal ABC transporter permease [Petrotoga]|uniref:Zinc transport system permease protein n=2 Tax=Petrotoga sibirica TaxID=156202 RepID=A0A4R8F2L4_9BACT|nr:MULTISPECIES: metal ABC transporter permease [Petrotoga]KUK83061.1 MAG: ABC-3 protein [Petrotoga mobilis]POZ88825.1 ABC transporter [Petrotoga sibirica DSM 13575]POZ90943.1 ABC transporter [Petrotoga sp. SL27]TDX17445.1 zinc transport system permease protein [Petrotoga sibirica]
MIDILSYPFMRYALIGAILSGFGSALLSNFIVLKKMEFIGNGAAHVAFGAIAFALFFGLNMNLLSIIVAIIFAIAINQLGKKEGVQENSVIGMLLSLSMAIGVILLSFKKGYVPEIDSFLFGDVLMITQQDLILLGIFDLFILSMVIFLNKELKYYSFNQRLSKIFGVPTNIINLVFLMITSVTIVVSVKIIGIILITSLLITPGVIAKLYAKSINQMLIISVIVGVFSSVLGIFLSYYLNVPSGPMIVLTLFLIFLIAYLLRKTVLKSFAQ